MRKEIHLNANDPLAWKAYADWLEEEGLPWEQPWIENSIGIKFVLIRSGTFYMGSPWDEEDRDTGEGPVHEVEITRPFYLSAMPVTQEQYVRVMGRNPSYFSATGSGKDEVRGLDTRAFPVENVSWEQAVEFCGKLSAVWEELNNGLSYGLPTEAQWEYACRGGTPSYQVFHFGNSLSSKQANFDGTKPYGRADKGDYLKRTSKVGSYPANGFGLHDMHGNVWEWCSDWFDEKYYAACPQKNPTGPAQGKARVLRGGGWNDYGRGCRSAGRLRDRPERRFQLYGFRLATVPT
jgi:formylglycine-generating enzyme required for sulfatase activity